MSVRANIAQGLKRTRKAAGKSVDDVAEQLGLSGKTISAWEVGRGQPDGDQLITICKYLGARLSDFYGREYDDLTEDEAELVSRYRSSSEQGKRQMAEYSYFILDMHPIDEDEQDDAES